MAVSGWFRYVFFGLPFRGAWVAGVGVDMTYVVVCTDFSSNKPHKQEDMGTLVTLGSQSDVMAITLAANVRYVGSIPTVGAIFPLFVTHTLKKTSRWFLTGYGTLFKLVSPISLSLCPTY